MRLLPSLPLPAGVSRRGLRGAGQQTALDRRLHPPAGPKRDESSYRHFPDNEIRLSTTPAGTTQPELALCRQPRFGRQAVLPRAPDPGGGRSRPGPVPREFYNSDFTAGVTPFLYDPSQGNLLFDVIAWQGYLPQLRRRSSRLANSPRVHPLGTQGFRTRLRSFSSRLFQCLTIQPYLVSRAACARFAVPTGDYNQNGVVDAADHVAWRSGFVTVYTQADYRAEVKSTEAGRPACIAPFGRIDRSSYTASTPAARDFRWAIARRVATPAGHFEKTLARASMRPAGGTCTLRLAMVRQRVAFPHYAYENRPAGNRPVT